MFWLKRFAGQGFGMSLKSVSSHCGDHPRVWRDGSRVGDPKCGRPPSRKVVKSSMAVKE
jgi:hypothetical protein